ncbi:outer membrane beta-barrel protein [Roseateles sp. NT4]|uniref:outer membrane beta-barrel protein n=1 Tax=Roseateles sp. NT4 TaxID=3453715 RepID=UPI003EED44D0
MNTKHVIALAAMVSAASAQAQFYAGVAAGQSRVHNCIGSCRQTGAKLTGGYSFGNGLSVEAGYVDFGKSDDNDIASPASVPENLVLDYVRFQAKALTLGARYSWNLGADWGLDFRLGVAQVKFTNSIVQVTHTQVTSGSDSQSVAKPYAGLALTYAVSPSTRLELGFNTTEYRYDRFSNKARLSLVTLGASYAF